MATAWHHSPVKMCNGSWLIVIITVIVLQTTNNYFRQFLATVTVTSRFNFGKCAAAERYFVREARSKFDHTSVVVMLVL